MNIENNIGSPISNTKKSFVENFNLKEQLLKYLKRWYWFLLSLIIFIGLAYLYLRYTHPLYNVSATIAISQEDNLSDSGLAAFKDLGLIDKSQNTIDNEIQVIKSRTIIGNVVKKLKLNTRYYTEGVVLETENYPNSLLEIHYLSADSVIYEKSAIFHVLVNSATSFSLVDKKGVKISDHLFGKPIKTKAGEVIITPNNKNIKNSLGKTIKIELVPLKSLIETYRNRLDIFPIGQGGSVLQISLNDRVRQKATDFINKLLDEYTDATIEHKKEVSNKTSEFIRKRLNLISDDLSEVETEAAGYRSRFGLTTDVGADAQRAASFDSQNMQEIGALNTQLSLISSMQNFIQSQEGKNDPIPANLGFDDPAIASNVARYNSLILQRKRLLRTSSAQNPVVVNIDEQINGLRQVLIGALNSIKANVNIKLNSLRTQKKYFSGKLYVAPTREKDLKVIQREQTVKEQLYLYLLQKREEAEITSNITVPNSRIIDRASTLGSYPVSPNKKRTYILAVLAGLFVPFLLIYLKELFNFKISSRGELENLTNLPIIGSIPKSKASNTIVVDKTSRTAVSEAFRIMSTNLDFMLAGVNKEIAKTIFVTSSISGEGKTFISSNLAKILSASGSKVAYVGTDFRYPKFHDFFELSKGKDTLGLTNYIMDENLQPNDIIYRQGSEDPFDVIPPGVIPPNPTGLLKNERIRTMFAYLKKNYDYVVVDTSPVSLVADTLLISDIADLTIYVVREEYSDKRLLDIPEKYNQDKRLRNVAILLNAAESAIGGNYGYGYGYGGKA